MINNIPQKFIREIQLILTLSNNDFYNSLISIEHWNLQNNPDCTPWKYQFVFPRRNAYLYIVLDNQGNCRFDLCINGEKYSLGGTEKGPKEIGQKSDLLRKKMEENHLNFCPPFTADFKKAVITAEVGTIIILNTTRAISCVKKENDILYFKNCYDGDLNNITMDSFLQGDIFEVNPNNFDDIQDLFESAYNTRSLTANIRVSIASNYGAYAVTELENKLKESESVSFNIGTLKLKAVKSKNKVVWYDTNNCKVKRDDIVNIFGWARLSIPEIKIKHFMFTPIENKIADAAFIQKIQYLSKSHKFEDIINQAFEYSNNQKEPAFLQISGLEDQKNGNYLPVTYSFYNDKIYKVFYDKNNNELPEKINEVSKDEFLQFCEQKYSEEIHYLETLYTPFVEQYISEHQHGMYKKIMLDAVIKEHIEKSPALISKAEETEISNAIKNLVQNIADNQEEPEYD